LRQARAADHVVTLSGYVRDRLLEKSIVPADRVTTLFHPDLTFRTPPTRRSAKRPLRILFFGRMFRYKRLDLFIEAIALLRAAGAPIEVTLQGAGNIGPYRQRLQELGVHVENRWLASHELGKQLRQHDVLALCHSEASQSGAIAAAFGAGLPVVAFGVGGIPEQVAHEVTGLIATDHTAASFAAAILRLLDRPELLERLKLGVQASMPQRSMRQFVGELWEVAERQMRGTADDRRDIVDPLQAGTSRKVAA
jgi:glycosyltransferase involved in cell wall biosynthesis